ncbi:MAG: phosphodiester glycosidase family protein [Candidatus Riflebacteria bacterium]|nr:phosphodiester glycosidase family protein [Candidatus Riflebacteria bacterium]
MKKITLFILMILCLSSGSNLSGYDLPAELKEGARQVLAQMSPKVTVAELGKLPEGFEIIEGSDYRGFKIRQGKLEMRVHAWTDETGLLDNYKRSEEDGLKIVAAVNGTFYCSRGVLGSVVSDSGIPSGLYQAPGKLSRCFIASFRGDKNHQTWYLGETSLLGGELLRLGFKERGWFNVPNVFANYCDNLLGGGGWILRGGKYVHNEAYERQRFRFRKADQNSRKTIIAQDSERSLYFLVFETGNTFYQAAQTLVKEPIFAKIREAIFLDGGSSSAIVVNGKYLVPPLYMVDRARFSCIQILVPELAW